MVFHAEPCRISGYYPAAFSHLTQHWQTSLDEIQGGGDAGRLSKRCCQSLRKILLVICALTTAGALTTAALALNTNHGTTKYFDLLVP